MISRTLPDQASFKIQIKQSKIYEYFLNRSYLNQKISEQHTIPEILSVQSTASGNPDDTLFTIKELGDLGRQIQLEQLPLYEAKLKDEIERRNKYRTDALRRRHKYDDFIQTYICMLIENNLLDKILHENMEMIKNDRSSPKKLKKK
jgi:hypothetical protein